MTRFPTVQAALARSAPGRCAEAAGRGLGYYRRAQNLHRGAQQVVRRLRRPACLPNPGRRCGAITGIGPYTAGAIASIAFGIPCPAVDGNVIRVVSRVAGIREDVGGPLRGRGSIAATAACLDTARAPRRLQSGADGPRSAAHLLSGHAGLRHAAPLASLLLRLWRTGDAEELLPIKSARSSSSAASLPYDVALLLRQENRVLLRQRTENAVAGAMGLPAGRGFKNTRTAHVKALHRALGLTCTYEKPA